MENITSKHGYKIGDIVWVKPNDANVLKGKVIGFQVVDDHLPIVEADNPYEKGKKFKNAFDLNRINPYKKGKTFYEWKLISVKHK